MSTCPGRNYCDPSQSGCGSQNRGVTWFYTNQSKTCDDVDTCLPSSGAAQDYCNRHASNYGGGTYDSYCFVSGSCGLFNSTESNWTCIRNTWDADNKLGCCTGVYNDPQACAPTWCPGNLDVCSEELRDFCGQEQNVASAQVCVDFCSLAENKVYCDQPMSQYCAPTESNNRQTPICSCIASQTPRPSCFDATCTQTGYQTASMLADAQNCGQFCQQIINCLQVGTCNVSGNNFTENCGNTIGCTGGATCPAGFECVDEVCIPNPTPPPSPGGFPWWIWLVVGIVIFLFIAAVIYYFARQ